MQHACTRPAAHPSAHGSACRTAPAPRRARTLRAAPRAADELRPARADAAEAGARAAAAEEAEREGAPEPGSAGFNQFDPAATLSRAITKRWGFAGGLAFVTALALGACPRPRARPPRRSCAPALLCTRTCGTRPRLARGVDPLGAAGGGTAGAHAGAPPAGRPPRERGLRAAEHRGSARVRDRFCGAVWSEGDVLARPGRSQWRRGRAGTRVCVFF